MNSLLILTGVCNTIAYRWLLLELHRSHIHIGDIEEKEDGLVIQVSGQQEDMFDCYLHLKDRITQAEADVKLELTSYEQ